MKTFICFVLLLSIGQGTAQAVKIQPIRINIDSMPLSLVPFEISDTIGAWLVDLTGQRLVTTRFANNTTGDLAESWTISPDGKTFTFELRKNAKFSDGTSVTSDDIVRCFRLVQKNIKKGYVSFYMKQVETITNPDPLHVQIKLKNNIAGFLSVLGEPLFTIWKNCNETICFTGSFLINKKSTNELSLIRMRDNQIFIFKELSFKDAVDSFNRHELEVLKTYSLMHVETAKKVSNERLIFNDERTHFLAFNTRSELFSDSRSRAFLKNNINLIKLDRFLKERGTRLSKSLLPPSLTNDDNPLNEASTITKSSSPNEAKFSRKVTVLILREHELDPLVDLTFDNIPHKILSSNKKDFLDHIAKGDYDVAIIGYGASIKNPHIISMYFYSQSKNNFAKISNNQIDSLVKKLWEERDPRTKLKIFSDILAFNDLNNWYVPIAHTPVIFGLSKSVQFMPNKSFSKDFFLPSPTLDLNQIFWKQE